MVGGTFVSTALRLSERIFQLGGLGLDSASVPALQRVADGVAAAVLTLPPEHAAEGAQVLACVLGLQPGWGPPTGPSSSSCTPGGARELAPSRRLLAHGARVPPRSSSLGLSLKVDGGQLPSFHEHTSSVPPELVSS